MQRRRRKPPQEPVTTTIHSLSHEGRGIATIDGKTTFIHNALPGEEVTFQYTYCSRSHDEGTMLRIERASEQRVTPPCKHYAMCGGCSMQHMSMAQQLAHKQETLLEQLLHFGKVTPSQIMPPLSTEELGYRHKARIGVRHVTKKEKVLVGFRERNGRYIADLESCPVLHPSIGERITQLSKLISQLSCYQHIAQLEVAVGEDKPSIIFRHLVEFTDDDKKQLIAFGKETGIDIYCQPEKPDSIYKLHPNDNVQRLSYTLPEEDITMKFHPADFTQVNNSLNRKMIQQTLELLAPKKTDTILDLFCGIGNFTLAIAKHAKKVVGVEGSSQAIERAIENSQGNNINNCEFHTDDLFKNCDSSPWFTHHDYDAILLDPPRSGAEYIVNSIENFNAKRIVYVSCNPATLARDAGVLVNDKGYKLEKTGIMNMFPHTTHVESIALFTKE